MTHYLSNQLQECLRKEPPPNPFLTKSALPCDWGVYISDEAKRDASEAFGLEKNESEAREALRSLQTHRPTVKVKVVQDWLVIYKDISASVHDSLMPLKKYCQCSGGVLYLVNQAANEVFQCPTHVPYSWHNVNFKIGKGDCLVSFVAASKEVIWTKDVLCDPRFPNGTGWKGSEAKAALCVPILTPSNELIGVFELTKTLKEGIFSKRHVEAVVTMTRWIGGAVEQIYTTRFMYDKSICRQYFFQLVHLYVSDVFTLPTILSEVMTYTRDILEAQNMSFYLLKESFKGTVFIPYCDSEIVDNNIVPDEAEELLTSSTLASQVMRTGKLINFLNKKIKQDFDNHLYERRRIKVMSCLCSPIKVGNVTVGAIELVNKKFPNGFNHLDEKILTEVADYCECMMSMADIANTIERIDCHIEVVDDTISHHLFPCENDLQAIHSKPNLSESVLEFTYYPEKFSNVFLCSLISQLFYGILGNNFVQEDIKLDSFLLSIGSMTSESPYLNFLLSFSSFLTVAGVVMLHSDDFITQEKEDLLLAVLCMNVNKPCFRTKTDVILDNYVESHFTPYSSTCHYVHLILKMYKLFIKRDDNKPSMSRIAGLGKLMHYSNDLASLKLRDQIKTLILNEEFYFENPLHRWYMMIVIMVVANFSDYFKRFDVSHRILTRKYNQMAYDLMDQSIKGELEPATQIDYINNRVIPWVYLLNVLLPKTEVIMKITKSNLKKWIDLNDLKGKLSWKPCDSFIVEHYKYFEDHLQFVEQDEEDVRKKRVIVPRQNIT